ncbi:Uncharacterised protein [Mycobacteroides abscessus subsp. massiliense]|uniref:hypothetical protein n=1 Tax=Mycobacteroides abscessus TaxID=36809 RepID=UPI0009A64A9A|nr:hypothetical protein [Mycobacteroides abscessus]SKI77699.1 Uncharacterised protein [Mycobacteroides abscessus subsp. massiliense]
MTTADSDFDLGTASGEEFDSASVDQLKPATPTAEYAKEHLKELQAAHGYRATMINGAINAVKGLLFASTFALGLYIWSEWEDLQPSVIVAYFASVVAETIGILYVIARYLFPSSGPRST